MRYHERHGLAEGLAPRHTVRRTALSLVTVLIAACASAPPGGPSLEDLRAARHKAEVMQLTRQAPVRCTWSRPGHELCTWRFSNREGAWWVLAPSIDTDHQVNFICEFPTDGSPGERGCEVIPRAARSFQATPAVASGGPEGRGARGVRRGRVAPTREEAWEQIGPARTALQMSRLVGDAPDRCAPMGERGQFCAWEVGKAHGGYEVLSAAADTDSWVLLSCIFPSDGSERAADACRVEAR